MGRPLRLKASNLAFHITSRTNGKRLFMKKSKDRKALCRILQRVKLKYSARIYGFTPMGNHFHLIMKVEGDADISRFMCEFKTAYAKYFNTKYDQSGHFWGERFHSTLIEEDRHMLACLRYIDRNPVMAGLVDHPSKYQDGSFAWYAYGKAHDILGIEYHSTYLALAAEDEKRQMIYLDYVMGKEEMTEFLPKGGLSKCRVFGNPEFKAVYL